MRAAPALVLAAMALIAPAVAEKSPEPFTITDVDRKLLEECAALDRQLEKRGLVLHDAELERQIGALGGALAPTVPLEAVTWRFRILRDPMVNAFALPNGSVYVHSGLLARAENEDQVAGVLAHEITHVARRHGFIFNRTLRKRTAAYNSILAAASWIPVGGTMGSVISAAASVSRFGIIVSVYGYSRELEQEADDVAAELIQSGGRDTRQLVRLFTLLDERLEPEPQPILLRTHDKTQQRIATLKTKLGMASEAPSAQDRRYLERMRPVLLQNLRLDIDNRRFRSAVAAASRLVDAAPEDPEALVWLGDAYRALGPRKPRLDEKELKFWSERRAYADEHNRSEEEQARRLAAKPEGRKALEHNQARAEELYRKAATVAPTQAKPHLGLGMLYQEQGKTELALTEFRRCLELAPNGPDRPRVEQRIAVLGGSK